MTTVTHETVASVGTNGAESFLLERVREILINCDNHRLDVGQIIIITDGVGSTPPDQLLPIEIIETLFDIAEEASKLRPSVSRNGHVFGRQQNRAVEYLVGAMLIKYAINCAMSDVSTGPLTVRIPKWVVPDEKGRNPLPGFSTVVDEEIYIELSTHAEPRVLRVPLCRLAPDTLDLARKHLTGVAEFEDEFYRFRHNDPLVYPPERRAARHTRRYNQLAVAILEFAENVSDLEEEVWEVLNFATPLNGDVDEVLKHLRKAVDTKLYQYVSSVPREFLLR